MAILAMSERQRVELEHVAAHTPLAKERSRAQAMLWAAEEQTALEVAECRR
jgi:hypothetical protein